LQRSHGYHESGVGSGWVWARAVGKSNGQGRDRSGWVWAGFQCGQWRWPIRLAFGVPTVLVRIWGSRLAPALCPCTGSQRLQPVGGGGIRGVGGSEKGIEKGYGHTWEGMIGPWCGGGGI
jgi:hypothetical protein